MRFDNYVSEGGFLTEKGKEVIQKTLGKGLTAFIGELAGEEELTKQQNDLIKSLAMKLIGDSIPYKKSG